MRPVFYWESDMQNKMMQAAMAGAGYGGADQFPPYGNMGYSGTAPEFVVPPPDPAYLPSALGFGAAGALGATLAGAPGLGTAATGLAGAGYGLGREYLAEQMFRQPARDAYNNEYGPNNQMPAGYGPNGPIFR